MSYEILDHPADVRFRARGATLEAAFTAAVAATGALVGTPDGDPSLTRAVDITVRDREALLFDLLNEVILWQDIEDAVVTDATAVEIEETDAGYRLSAVLHARPIPADAALLDIKAPTYSQMRVEHGDGWTVEAVLDV